MAFSECFNSVIVNVRHKPLLTILEAIRVIVLERMNKIREISRKWNPGVCPNIKKRLEWLKEKQRFWHVIPGGGKLFEVRLGSEGFTVDEEMYFVTYHNYVKLVPGMNFWPDQSMRSNEDEGLVGLRSAIGPSRGCQAGGSGGVSGSRGRGTTGLRGGASGSIDEPEQSQDEPEKTQAEPQQTQHKPEQTQVEDQVEQTKDQAEIDLTQVEQA
ncbi:hypothetical protein Tco_0674300 [Tanacetum coccineum]